MLRTKRVCPTFSPAISAMRRQPVCVKHWGPMRRVRSRKSTPVLTGVLLPDEHDADHVRYVILDKFDMSLGTGPARLGKVFRIGHLGHLND